MEHGVDDNMLDEIIMAVDLQKRDTVGCCYYVAREETLYFMEDAQCAGSEVLDACLWPQTFTAS